MNFLVWLPPLLTGLILDYKFDLMYSKRAFVHWYVGEGMEEVTFSPVCTCLSVTDMPFPG